MLHWMRSLYLQEISYLHIMILLIFNVKSFKPLKLSKSIISNSTLHNCKNLLQGKGKIIPISIAKSIRAFFGLSNRRKQIITIKFEFQQQWIGKVVWICYFGYWCVRKGHKNMKFFIIRNLESGYDFQYFFFLNQNGSLQR